MHYDSTQFRVSSVVSSSDSIAKAMSTPVVTNQWAGNYDCEGPCRRKRLMAEEFSKKALERYRKQIRQPQGKPMILRCKQCVAEAERLEREAAAAKKKKKKAARDYNKNYEPPENS